MRVKILTNDPSIARRLLERIEERERRGQLAKEYLDQFDVIPVARAFCPECDERSPRRSSVAQLVDWCVRHLRDAHEGRLRDDEELLP